MADLPALKKERTAAKRAVSIAAGRLHHGIQLHMDSVPEMSRDLDSKFCDFLSSSEAFRYECVDQNATDEFVTVNGMTPDQYETEVQKTYTDARDAYRTYVSSFTMQTVNPPHPSHDSSSGLRTSSSTPVNLKKRDVPKFSGLRKDWPEFKSVWEKIVVPSLPNRTALASELKNSCKGGAGYDEISNISAGSENAYKDMWTSLCAHYDNVTLSVYSALDEIKQFKRASEDDYAGIVKLIRSVDSIYQQLKVLNQVTMVSNREVNEMMSYFPPLVRKDWAEAYYLLESDKQLKPFESLHTFLTEKMKIAKLMADTQRSLSEVKITSKSTKSSYNTSAAQSGDKGDRCCIHGTQHSTESCRLFKSLSVNDRKARLSKERRCFRCFGGHQRSKCKVNTPCEKCGKTTHHKLMCSPPPPPKNDSQGPPPPNDDSRHTILTSSVRTTESLPDQDVDSNGVKVDGCVSRSGSSFALYAIFEVPVTSSPHKAVVFCDDGADASFISQSGVKKLKATKLRDAPIEMTTLNGTQSVSSCLYEVNLLTTGGKRVTIVAFSLPSISGPVSKINEDVISQIFPNFDPSSLQRPDSTVDLLLGGDYFGLHPKTELATDGNHLSIMQGVLGVCVQGTHPALSEATITESCMGHSVTAISANYASYQVVTHREYDPILLKCPPSEFVSCAQNFNSGGDKSACSLSDPVLGVHNTNLSDIQGSSIQNFSSDNAFDPRLCPQDSGLDFQASGRQNFSSGDALGDSGLCPQGSSADAAISDDQNFNSDNPSGEAADISACFGGDSGSSRSLSPHSSRLSADQNFNSDGSSGRDSGVCPHWPSNVQDFSPDNSSNPSQNPPHCYSVSSPRVDEFVMGELLGTEVNPRCGGCKCGKCPIMGHTYSFKEEQELKLIDSKLRYDADNMVWVAGYPWICDPALLPDNRPAAMATLRSTEKKLATDPDWADKYAEQIRDHEDRGVARKLSQDELEAWSGPVFYLSHMALEQPKSLTTPVRIVFNSSQVYRGVSLNSFLAKGPDAYNNNLLGMLLRFRENPVVMVGDIKKMYNSVFLEELERHTHRFLWRDLEDRAPDVWCMTRVNLGDRPAGTIAIVAKDKTADMFRHIDEQAADLIKYSTYTDDIIDSIIDYLTALKLAGNVDLILSKGGFKTKGWTFGGQGVPDASPEVKVVLGVSWVASEDVILFPVMLNFSPKRRNVYTGPNLTSSDVPRGIPSTLSRRIVLQQVMAVFDPFGILAPFLLRSKVLLRETWLIHLGWDDSLPSAMWEKWERFFTQLFDIEQLRFDRCVKPRRAVGNPMLVLLSDGSEIAYGCAAYIRWTLDDGSFWCRLLLAKCRIAPINRVSIPQMELNGAVLSKRCRKVIETESRFKFDRILHLVDSETVLCMIHKLSTRFRVYEGVRIGEIQAATNGDVSCWAWVSGNRNIADWITRGRSPNDLGPSSEWFAGPEFLYAPEDTWALKFNPVVSDCALPGEKKMHTNVQTVTLSSPSYTRRSTWRVIVRAVARVMAVLRSRSFKGGCSLEVTPEMLRAADQHLLQEAQSSAWTAKSVKLQFRTLRPVLKDGLWVVGLRISHCSPLTPDNKPQILIPHKHPISRVLMQKAHQDGCHRGRDATLAKFRARFWTSHASKISKAVCDDCQLCKLIHDKRLSQLMGQMPPDRLIPSPPFNSVMLDLFGPYYVRGEVQKRTTGKAWGVIFTDLCCRAVHIEVMFGYDTKSFLLALARFAAVRGWPSKIFSDPGSQLRGANEELVRVWKSLDKQAIMIHGSKHGVEWKFGPTDSPWYQGAAEALIRSAKKAIHLSVKDRRLTVPEILTVFTEAANLLNERPLGVMPGPDAPINILTPNSLLLGRSSAINPGGYESKPSLRSRLTLVEDIVRQFWSQWTNLYAPTLIQQSKWLHEKQALQVGDVVLVADKGVFKGEYRLARVSEILPSADGLVRRVKVCYKNYKVGETIHEYAGAPDTVVERSVQTLSLLVPVSKD